MFKILLVDVAPLADVDIRDTDAPVMVSAAKVRLGAAVNPVPLNVTTASTASVGPGRNCLVYMVAVDELGLNPPSVTTISIWLNKSTPVVLFDISNVAIIKLPLMMMLLFGGMLRYRLVQLRSAGVNYAVRVPTNCIAYVYRPSNNMIMGRI
jgi:hypothetical protein